MMQTPTGGRREPEYWWCLVVSAVILAGTLAFGFGFDHGILQYMAWAALEGHIPYTESWDTVFPGGLLPHLLVIGLGGHSVFWFRLLDWAVQMATVAMLYRSAARVADRTAGFLAGSLYAVAYAIGGYYHTAQRDGFIVPLMLGALVLIESDRERPARRTLCAAGAVLGVICLIRPTYVILALAIAVYRLWTPVTRRPAAADLLAFGVCCAAPLAGVLAVYAAMGALRPIVELTGYLLLIYSGVERASTPDVLMAVVRYTPKVILAGTVLAIVSSRDAIGKRAAGWWLLLACAIAVRVIESKTYRYQFWPLVACLALLAGVGWSRLIAAASEILARVGLHRERARIGLMLAGLAATVIIARAPARNVWRLVPDVRQRLAEPSDDRLMLADSSSQAALARHIREHSAPGDTIQAWAGETGIYYAARRRSASRFTDSKAFLCRDRYELFATCAPTAFFDIQERWKNEFLRDVRERRPRFIVASYENGSLASHHLFSSSPDFPELRALIDRDYRLDATFGTLSVFRANTRE